MLLNIISKFFSNIASKLFRIVSAAIVSVNLNSDWIMCSGQNIQSHETDTTRNGVQGDLAFSSYCSIEETTEGQEGQDYSDNEETMPVVRDERDELSDLSMENFFEYTKNLLEENQRLLEDLSEKNQKLYKQVEENQETIERQKSLIRDLCSRNGELSERLKIAEEISDKLRWELLESRFEIKQQLNKLFVFQ